MPLIDSLGTTPALAEIFSDRSVLQAMLDFEAALAMAESQHRIIPTRAARAIARAAQASSLNAPQVASAAQQSATLAIPLVNGLTEAVRRRNRLAAGFVHWGATSQDVSDTAMVLLLKKAHPLLEADLLRLQKALRTLSQQNRGTVMLARTLLQPAPPTTLGLKTAGWLTAIHRSHRRVAGAFAEALVLQFGGASGTLAALGHRGIVVGRTLAERLELSYPDAPWHSHRDRLAALLCACAILGGSLGKMARDITLLMQSEVGEVSEARRKGGGSSTMPHKHNPAGCVVALAAVSRLPGLISGFLAGMVQEHERAAGAWQAEWPVVSQVVQCTGAALAAMANVAEGLMVDPARMRKNIASTRGAFFAERAVMLLGQYVGRDVAHEVVQRAVKLSNDKEATLSQALAEMEEAKKHMDSRDLSHLEEPEQYLGCAQRFQNRLLRLTEDHGPTGRFQRIKPQK